MVLIRVKEVKEIPVYSTATKAIVKGNNEAAEKNNLTRFKKALLEDKEWIKI
jgi:hypothetical protein